MAIFKKLKIVKTTAFADFIRNASAREKKRVYSAVMKKATERQLEMIRLAGKKYE